jgi:23S rRNA (pseudouridine1915-N3)-methyltransferase
VKVAIRSVGRPGGLLRSAIEEYERRAGRYWTLDVATVPAVRGGKSHDEREIRKIETQRLMDRVPHGLELTALTPDGVPLTSGDLARYLNDLAVHGRPGAAFVIGGAFGLDEALLAAADAARLSLGAMTLPHELARLVLAEQLYRAGTIVRREPYHK